MMIFHISSKERDVQEGMRWKQILDTLVLPAILQRHRTLAGLLVKIRPVALVMDLTELLALVRGKPIAKSLKLFLYH